MSTTERRRASRQEPMFNAPGVVIGLALVLIAIYALFSRANFALADRVLHDFAFVPGRLTVWIWPGRAIDLLVRAQQDGDALAQAQAMRDLHALGGGLKPWTLLTYAFLHGSWTHVLLNTVWLIAFGPPVARRTMAVGFLGFMAVTGVAAALAQWAATPMEFAPLIGASGAVSGLMGAVTRFMFQPGAPLGPRIGPGRVEIEDAPVASLREVFTDSRTLGFLGIWMVSNFVFGAFGRTLGLSDMPVAWVAHLGGFFAGLVLFPVFDRMTRR
jgi:membrane associated rhomboid family serine protease